MFSPQTHGVFGGRWPSLRLRQSRSVDLGPNCVIRVPRITCCVPRLLIDCLRYRCTVSDTLESTPPLTQRNHRELTLCEVTNPSCRVYVTSRQVSLPSALMTLETRHKSRSGRVSLPSTRCKDTKIHYPLLPYLSCV